MKISQLSVIEYEIETLIPYSDRKMEKKKLKKLVRMTGCFYSKTKDEIIEARATNVTIRPCGACPKCKSNKTRVYKSYTTLYNEIKWSLFGHKNYKQELKEISSQLQSNKDKTIQDQFIFLDYFKLDDLLMGTVKFPVKITNDLFKKISKNDLTLVKKFMNDEFEFVVNRIARKLKVKGLANSESLIATTQHQLHCEKMFNNTDKSTTDFFHIHYLLFNVFHQVKDKVVDVGKAVDFNNFRKLFEIEWIRYISFDFLKNLKHYVTANIKQFDQRLVISQNLMREIRNKFTDDEKLLPTDKKHSWSGRLYDRDHLIKYFGYLNKFQSHQIYDFKFENCTKRLKDRNIEVTFKKYGRNKSKVDGKSKSFSSFYTVLMTREDFFDILLGSHISDGRHENRKVSGLFKLALSDKRSELIYEIMTAFNENKNCYTKYINAESLISRKLKKKMILKINTSKLFRNKDHKLKNPKNIIPKFSQEGVLIKLFDIEESFFEESVIPITIPKELFDVGFG